MKAGHHADHEGVGTVLAGGTPAVSYGQSVLLASVYLVAAWPSASW
ncbi:MAG: hypothetical protein GY745_05475 [Actinomycetia bacterium]|nr:hypothetical protein [Actinomycetes bacterium]MCP4084486.1 hypothetical protein [Actinomycetes bacterium]